MCIFVSKMHFVCMINEFIEWTAKVTFLFIYGLGWIKYLEYSAYDMVWQLVYKLLFIILS